MHPEQPFPAWFRIRMYYRVILGLILPVTFACASENGSQTTDNALQTQVDAFLRPYVESRNFSGTVLIARAGDILVSKGYGRADDNGTIPGSTRTKFQVGSISKTFTAAAILLLQEQNRLRLDDPIQKFIPAFPHGDEITIHHLLVHTSGLTRYVFLPDYREKTQQPHTTDDLVRWIQDKPLAFETGARSGYSTANFALLAHIIEQVSGQAYGTFLQTHIFEPLELKNTGHRARPAPPPNMATGYVPVGSRDLTPARFHDYTIDTGSGSLYMTADDLHTWYTALYGGRLLSRETLDLMFTKHIDLRGYGWEIDRWFERDVIRMGGWDGVGFTSRIVHFREEDTTVIVLCNLNISTVTEEIVRNLSAIVLEETYEPLHLDTASVDASVASQIAGLYQFGADFYVPNSTIRITHADGYLSVPGDQPGQQSALLRLSENIFVHRAHWFRITFRWTDDGQITGMKYGPFDAMKVSED